jgi:P27 family predicted phage terminase small subunit
MGRRGPKPEPTILKVLKGTKEQKDLMGEMNPTGLLTCPQELSTAARAEWKRITKVLPPGLLTAADRSLLASYCSAWALWREASGHVQSEGLVLEGKDGGSYQNPWLSILNKQVQIMASLSGRFGLSPSDRNGIKVPEVKEGGKWSKDLLG